MDSLKKIGPDFDNIQHSVTSQVPTRGMGFDVDTGLKGVALWHWDFLSDTVTFSPEWRRLLRLSDDTPLVYTFEKWAGMIHTEDAEDVSAAAEQVRNGQSEDVHKAFRVERGDGCWAWLLTWGKLHKSDQGRLLGAMGTVTDISALRADAKFQHGGLGVGDTAYHAMLENSPDLLVRMDRELFPLYINPVVSRYMGRTAQEYSFSEDLQELKIDPEQLRFLKEKVEWVFDKRSSIREMVTFVDAFGREISGEYSFWPEFDAEGNVISAMTHFRDLTEQAEAEKKALHNAKRLNALYKLTQMGEAPEEEVLRFVLDSFLELTGSQTGFVFIPHNELTGPGRVAWSAGTQRFYSEEFYVKTGFFKGLADLGTNEEDLLSYRLLINGDGDAPVIDSFEDVYDINRGALVPVIENDRIVCFAGVGNKETDYVEFDLQQLEMFLSGAWLVLRRHDYFRELRIAKEAAEHANRVKDEFLANVSHELRTPLNGLLSMLQLMEYLQLSDEQREYIRAANLSGNALLRIISDILDYSRMARGKMELLNENFDLKQTVQSTLSLFGGEAEQKALKFTYDLDNAIPRQLLGDDARVRQIVFNLVGNALKFTEQGGISVGCRVMEENKSENKVRVIFFVKDTGIGIPAEQQSRIFDAFTQVDSSSTRKYAGTGLGLGIVKHLVHLMNGSISLESDEGTGTLVSCELEFELAAQAPEELSIVRSFEEGGAHQRLDILVAEDDSVSRFAIRAFLKRLGHTVVCVNNGREAIGALKLYPFDCLLTDIQMPDMDGMELTRRVRENQVDDIPVCDTVRAVIQDAFPDSDLAEKPINRRIVIFAVSAHAMAGDRERFLKRGMDDYISKPIVAEELAASLNRLTVRRGESFLDSST